MEQRKTKALNRKLTHRYKADNVDYKIIASALYKQIKNKKGEQVTA